MNEQAEIAERYRDHGHPQFWGRIIGTEADQAEVKKAGRRYFLDALINEDEGNAEEVLKRLPGARLVKAFNTIYFKHLQEQGRTDVPVEERRHSALAHLRR